MYIILRSDSTGHEKIFIGSPYADFHLAYTQLTEWFSRVVEKSVGGNFKGTLYACFADHLNIPVQYYWILEIDVVKE